ncbi:DoxX family protein [Syntrophobacter sp. SbD1]|nr:DoxX family protein [Syntrophobacter sp. SbD1]
MKSRLERYLFLCTRLVLGAIFIAASISKIAYPPDFAKVVANYRILPDYLVNIVAVVLPWLEAVVGALIVCGRWLPGAVALANVLLLVFFGAMAQAAARGIDLHCGCFSSKAAGAPHMLWYLARDFLFLLLGAAVMIRLVRERFLVTKNTKGQEEPEEIAK